MRRTRLTWMAIGLAIGVFACTAASLLFRKTHEQHLYLQIHDWGLNELYDSEKQITDDRPSGQGEQQFNMKIAVDRERKRVEPISMLQEAWKCGFRQLHTERPSHGLVLSIPLDPEQRDQIRCLVSLIQEHSIPFHISDSQYP